MRDLEVYAEDKLKYYIYGWISPFVMNIWFFLFL